MTTELSMPGNVFIDRSEVPVLASKWQISPVEGFDVVTSATGESFQTLARVAPGYPMIRTKRRFKILWDDAGDARRQLDRVVAVPGSHRLILWRRETLAYRSDGVRTVYHLPAGWTHAVDQVGFPPDIPAAQVAPELDVDGAALTWAPVDDATFDGAASPPAGTFWTRQGGGDIRLDEAPAAGATIYGRFVPEYTVLRLPLETVNIEKFNVEPLGLAFQEA